MAETNDRLVLSIADLSKNDVLLGRGTGPNINEGNVRFRELISQRKEEYLTFNPRDHKNKNRIAKEIVAVVRSRGGRFLRREAGVETGGGGGSGGSETYELADEAAVLEKAKQALRQNRLGRARSAHAAAGVRVYEDSRNGITVDVNASTASEQSGDQPFLTEEASQHLTAHKPESYQDQAFVPHIPADEGGEAKKLPKVGKASTTSEKMDEEEVSQHQLPYEPDPYRAFVAHLQRSQNYGSGTAKAATGNHQVQNDVSQHHQHSRAPSHQHQPLGPQLADAIYPPVGGNGAEGAPLRHNRRCAPVSVSSMPQSNLYSPVRRDAPEGAPLHQHQSRTPHLSSSMPQSERYATGEGGGPEGAPLHQHQPHAPQLASSMPQSERYAPGGVGGPEGAPFCQHQPRSHQLANSMPQSNFYAPGGGGGPEGASLHQHQPRPQSTSAMPQSDSYAPGGRGGPEGIPLHQLQPFVPQSAGSMPQSDRYAPGEGDGPDQLYSNALVMQREALQQYTKMHANSQPIISATTVGGDSVSDYINRNQPLNKVKTLPGDGQVKWAELPADATSRNSVSDVRMKALESIFTNTTKYGMRHGHSHFRQERRNSWKGVALHDALEEMSFLSISTGEISDMSTLATPRLRWKRSIGSSVGGTIIETATGDDDGKSHAYGHADHARSMPQLSAGCASSAYGGGQYEHSTAGHPLSESQMKSLENIFVGASRKTHHTRDDFVTYPVTSTGEQSKRTECNGSHMGIGSFDDDSIRAMSIGSFSANNIKW